MQQALIVLESPGDTQGCPSASFPVTTWIVWDQSDQRGAIQSFQVQEINILQRIRRVNFVGPCLTEGSFAALWLLLFRKDGRRTFWMMSRVVTWRLTALRPLPPLVLAAEFCGHTAAQPRSLCPECMKFYPKEFIITVLYTDSLICQQMSRGLRNA